MFKKSESTKIIFAFLKKDFKNAWSYKVQFFGTIITTLISIVIFFFISDIFLIDKSEALNNYGNNYLQFVFIGLIFSELSFLMISSLSNEIANYRISGTFEEILNSNIPDVYILSSSYAYPIVAFLIRLSIYCSIGILFLDLDLIPDYGMLIFILLILLSIFSLIGIGLISASYTILFFKGNPFLSIYTASATLFGGVFFPYSSLPEFTQYLSYLIPITHSLELIRSPVYITSGSDDFFFHLSFLISTSILYVLIGYLLCIKALKSAKNKGSLLFY